MPLLPLRAPWTFVAGFVILAATLVGCGGESDTPSEPSYPQQHTLVFIDRSASTGAYPEAEALFADSLQAIVRSRLKRPGDRMSLFIVHEKTLSKSPRLDLRNAVSPLERKDFADEQALENARYKKEVEEYLQEAEDEALSFMTGASRSEFARWTDLWGTLGVASEEFGANDGSRSVDRAVYYFSDMFESMPGPDRRNFDRSPPSSRAQAESWAAEDATRLDDEMILRPSVLQPARFRILMGPLATKSGAQPVKFYWLSLFDEVGIDTVAYN